MALEEHIGDDRRRDTEGDHISKRIEIFAYWGASHLPRYRAIKAVSNDRE